jgi:hypothetical protein
MIRMLLGSLLFAVTLLVQGNPIHQRIIELNVEQLKLSLQQANDSKSMAASAIIIKLPKPDGSWHRYRMVKNTTLSSGLVAKFPQISTYDGFDLDPSGGFMKLDITPHGLHAMILTPGQSTVYIDPLKPNDSRRYKVYLGREYAFKKLSKCLNIKPTSTDFQYISKRNNAKQFGACELTTYRLALAATAQYTAATGGTVEDALAAQITTINRVNGIYETDSAVTFEIIANNDEIIYVDPNSQPYTHGDPFALVNENQFNLDSVIGSNNYDIGQVFDTVAVGYAPGKTCRNSDKAMGTTGLPNPVGDPFDVDFVAHELGHQLGANHTQNNDCNRFPPTAVEPGSGSTVMSYAGICAPNVQKHSDPYLHGINLEEIGNFVNLGAGRLCGVRVPIGKAPIIRQPPNITVPKSSPFLLTASAEGQALRNYTFAWEQMDNQITPQPPSPYAKNGPNFRSVLPSKSPTRYFPNLQELSTDGPFTWEVIPAVNRTMHFRVTVRSNPQGPSCNAYRDMTVTVDSKSGPVTIPRYPFQLLPTVWVPGSTAYLSWDPAGTLFPPVGEGFVDILFSTDGGRTFPFIIASHIFNLGELEFPVPLVKTRNGRVMIRGEQGRFFTVWEQRIRIL